MQSPFLCQLLFAYTNFSELFKAILKKKTSKTNWWAFYGFIQRKRWVEIFWGNYSLQYILFPNDPLLLFFWNLQSFRSQIYRCIKRRARKNIIKSFITISIKSTSSNIFYTIRFWFTLITREEDEVVKNAALCMCFLSASKLFSVAVIVFGETQFRFKLI